MSKIITSPVEYFAGTVTLSEPMNMSQVLGWEMVIRQAQVMEKPIYITDLNALYLPAILPIVETWNLTGIPSNPTSETFPFTPRLQSAELFSWLIGEIRKIYVGEIPDGEKND